MLRGTCPCGGIQYTIAGDLELPLNCHCSMCRKATGAAFRSRARVSTAAFHWVTGEELLSRYESSPGHIRTFCRVCGSTLVTMFPDSPEELGLAMGTLDDDPGVQPQFHVYVDSLVRHHRFASPIRDHAERRGALSVPSCRLRVRSRRASRGSRRAPAARATEHRRPGRRAG